MAMLDVCVWRLRWQESLLVLGVGEQDAVLPKASLM